MIMSNPIAIFFDLGDTLVIPRFGADGALAALQPLPFVTEVLDRVRSDGTVAAPHRLGVMSNGDRDHRIDEKAARSGLPASRSISSTRTRQSGGPWRPPASGLVPSASPLSRVAADPMSSRMSKGVSDV